MNRGKKILLWLASAIVLLVLLVGTSPYWLGLVLPAVLQRFHITYGTYHRICYSQFELRDVNYTLDGTRLHARAVNGLTPILWWWKKQRQPEATFLNASGWTLSIGTKHEARAESSFPYSMTKAQAQINRLRNWVARAEWHDGLVEVHNQTVTVPIATWSNGNLAAIAGLAHLNESATIDAQLNRNFPWTATAIVPTREIRAQITVTNATTLGGFIMWRTNRADIAATFPPKGTLPERALIGANNFRITAQDFNLYGYDEVTGALQATWSEGKFAANLRANATPLATSTNLVPVMATLAATGDTNEATLQRFTISLPGLEAHLSAPLSVTFRGQMLNRSASFVVKGDLSKQPFLPLRGFVTGTASLHRKRRTYPEVIFDLAGEHVSGFDIETANIKTQGQLNWPLLQLHALNARFVNGTTANITTSVDLKKRFIEHGSIAFSGKLGEDLLPLGYDYERLSLHAYFSGPINRLKHSGDLTLGEVVVPYMKSFRALAKWEGEGTNLKTFSTEMRVSKNATVRMSGAADLSKTSSTNRFQAKIDKLTIVSGNQTFALKTGTTFTAELAQTNKYSEWKADLSSVQLRSPRSELMFEAALNGTTAGRFSIDGRRLESRLLNAFLIRPLPEVRIAQISSSAVWSNGPAKWNLDLNAQSAPPLTNTGINLTNFSARVQMFGDARGTTITNTTFSEKGQPVAAVSGRIPLTIEPARIGSGITNVVKLHEKSRMHLQASTLGNASFWQAITQGSPVTIQNPSLNLLIDGSPAEPHGTAHLAISAGTINTQILTNSIRVALANFQADIAITRSHLTLQRFSLLVEGQPISATGTLPLPSNLERDWRKIFDWRKANVLVRASNVQIAPFAALEKQFISPQGTLSANVNLNRGQINGSLIVANAATLPIGQFGAIRDINARLNFTGNRVQIERGVGTLSGGPVSVSGFADLSRIDPKTKLPQFRLNIRGDSVPVVRRSDLIVRTKFDLVAANINNGPVIVTGDVGLQNSFLLNDLRFLVPHVARPQTRPPFFSIQAEPFAGWKLDVNVKGNQFLRVRTPFFNGVCSANLHLGGTLAEPVALGDATINSGSVQFPFANVTVTQGFITLTTAHPYMPHLFITGSTRAYDFDIRMNITGPVENPRIEFTSTPALPSEQILAMMTTGTLPATTSALTLQQRTLAVGAFLGKNLLTRFGLAPGNEQRLTISSSRDLSEQNTETYSVQYKVNPDWSVISDYNRFGGLNLGLKWRFYSK